MNNDKTFEELLKEKGFEVDYSEFESVYATTYDFSISKGDKKYGNISVEVPHDNDKAIEATATVSDWMDRGGYSKRSCGYISKTITDEDMVQELLGITEELVKLNDEMKDIPSDMSIEDENEMLDHLSDINGEEADLSDLYESANLGEIFKSVLNS